MALLELDLRTKECVKMEFEYEYEIIDNGVILTDKNIGTKIACLVQNNDESEVIRSLGTWLLVDIDEVLGDEAAAIKFKISLKIEPIE